MATAKPAAAKAPEAAAADVPSSTVQTAATSPVKTSPPAFAAAPVRTAVAAAKPDNAVAPTIAQTAPSTTPAFSLQPAAPTVAISYSPSAVPAAPPATTLSPVAIDSLAALGMQISRKLKDGNTRFDIELHPADLGKVDVALTIARDGKVSAHLSFDSPVTATAFHARESELRQQLSAAGLDVGGDALSFSSRDRDGNPGSSQQQASSSGQDPHSRQTPQQTPQQAARSLAEAGQAADATDLDTLIANFANHPASGRLALNLLV